MLGIDLTEAFEKLLAIGAVRSKRHFSETYLLRGRTYLRDFEQMRRSRSSVSACTVAVLQARLNELADYAPGGIADELRAFSVKLGAARINHNPSKNGEGITFEVLLPADIGDGPSAMAFGDAVQA